jgi:hypothetical protein
VAGASSACDDNKEDAKMFFAKGYDRPTSSAINKR